MEQTLDINTPSYIIPNETKNWECLEFEISAIFFGKLLAFLKLNRETFRQFRNGSKSSRDTPKQQVGLLSKFTFSALQRIT